MTGAEILAALDKVTDRPEADRSFTPAASARRIAAELGDGDMSRQVSGQLVKLRRAGLVTRAHRARRLKSGRIKEYTDAFVYSPTIRGREVARILARIAAANNGYHTRALRSAAGIKTIEEIHLR